MSQEQSHQTQTAWTLRPYKNGDHPAVAGLYGDGLLEGQLASNDTAADIENIREAYLKEPRNHFWVAEAEGQVVGMIGVAEDEPNVAEIRRLRVRKDWQQSTLAAHLVETALVHCKRHGYLKVIFDTHFEKSAAIEAFTRLGFQHNRSKNVHGMELLEFYLDLYRTEKE